MEMKIWEQRTKKNWGLEQLEQRTGISHSALHNYEMGKRSPRMTQMEAIAKALDVKITDLFDSPYK